MRKALSIGVITLAIAAGAIAAFGWPGAIIAIALAPGLILGTTVAHVVDSWIGRDTLRIAFTMMGTVLGIFSTIIAVLFIGAATIPEHVTIEHTRQIDLPPSMVWEHLEEPVAWARWDTWLGRIEPEETTSASRSSDQRRYRTTLMMGSTEVPTHHVATEVVADERFVWSIALPPGSALLNVVQEVTLTGKDGGTQVRYGISYDLPSLTARALHAMMYARGLQATAEAALESLDMLARQQDQN